MRPRGSRDLQHTRQHGTQVTFPSNRDDGRAAAVRELASSQFTFVYCDTPGMSPVSRPRNSMTLRSGSRTNSETPPSSPNFDGPCVIVMFAALRAAIVSLIDATLSAAWV